MRRTGTFQTRFQALELWQSDTSTEFRVAGAIHASHHRSRFLTGLAWDLIAAAALLRAAGPPRSLLMLGLAGGTACRVLRHLLPECRITAIDIDAEILALAHAHMNLGALDLEIITADAYPWLARNRRRFDVVFDDIYLAGKTDVFRSRVWDAALLGHLRRAVAADGLLALNLVTGSGHRRMQSQTRQILRETFPVVRSLTTSESMNEVLVAGAEVATRSRLAPFDAAFDDWRDRMFWERIDVRKLSQ